MAEQISIDVIFNAINKTGNVFGAVNKGLNGLTTNLWKINQTADLFGRANQALNDLGAPGKEYDFGLAELSAITGIAGSELSDLGKMARKVGKESGLGATGALEAYKLLASQIEVDSIGMKGLNELQAKTITLAQASPQLGLAGAANALAGTINQFGLEASQAGRIMNVLAAGSKYGAAEIPDLAQSFKVVGASANAAGLSVESTAGAIEVLSKNNLKGAEAGTSLRNVLLKMQTELGFDFKVTKLSDALKTLTDKQGDATYMTKIFGMENITAAQFLVKNADAVDEMTKKVTNTTVATEQAAIMNQTWIHKADLFKAKLNDLSIGFFQSNAGLLNWVSLGGQAAMTITALSPVFGFMGKGIIGMITASKGIMTVVKVTKLMNMALAAGNLSTVTGLIARYGMAGRIAAGGIWVKNAALTAWNFITGITMTSLTGLIAKTWAWTAALMANPVTWVVGGVVALVAVLALAWKHFDGFRGGVVGAWEGLKAFGKILIDSVLNPLKQLLGGIGKVGKAIALLFKGQFSDAWKEAKDGFGDIGGAALKMNPIYTVSQVINRRDEIATAASAGYKKGKAIDTSSFLNFSGKKSEQPISATDLANAGQPAPFEVWRNPNIKTPLNPQAQNVWNVQNLAAPVKNVSSPVVPIYPGIKQPVFPDVWKNQNLAAPAPAKPAVTAPSVYNNTSLNTTNLEQLTRNITQNVANNNSTTNQTNQANNQKIEVTYSPQISISANLTKESQDNLMKLLYADKDALMKLIREEQRKDGRLSYAG